jgi:uncharacterized membrane protein YeiH
MARLMDLLGIAILAALACVSGGPILSRVACGRVCVFANSCKRRADGTLLARDRQLL